MSTLKQVLTHSILLNSLKTRHKKVQLLCLLSKVKNCTTVIPIRNHNGIKRYQNQTRYKPTKLTIALLYFKIGASVNWILWISVCANLILNLVSKGLITIKYEDKFPVKVTTQSSKRSNNSTNNYYGTSASLLPWNNHYLSRPLRVNAISGCQGVNQTRSRLKYNSPIKTPLKLR